MPRKKQAKEELRFVLETSLFFEDVRGGKVVDRVEIKELPKNLKEYQKFHNTELLKGLVRIFEEEIERITA